MTHYKSIAAGLAAFVSASVLAHGQSQPIIVEHDLPTAFVSYADLDLTSVAGVATLNGRVRRAAEQICIDQTVRGAREWMAGRNCYTLALNNARQQIEQAIATQGSPQLAGRSMITVAGR